MRRSLSLFPLLPFAGALLLTACGGGAAASNTEAQLPPTAASSSSASTTPDAPPPAPSSTVASTAPATPFCPAVGKITFEGGQGTSMEDAVRIVGAKGEMDGVASEYACLDAAFGPRKSGAWKLLRQSLLGKDGKNYDLMSIQLADGTKKEILFDISAYFGKF